MALCKLRSSNICEAQAGRISWPRRASWICLMNASGGADFLSPEMWPAGTNIRPWLDRTCWFTVSFRTLRISYFAKHFNGGDPMKVAICTRELIEAACPDPWATSGYFWPSSGAHSPFENRAFLTHLSNSGIHLPFAVLGYWPSPCTFPFHFSFSLTRGDRAASCDRSFSAKSGLWRAATAHFPLRRGQI